MAEGDFDGRSHRGDGTSQLVRCVCREAYDLGVVSGQAVEQAIDRACQLIELVA